MARGIPKSDEQKAAEARKTQALNDFIQILQETNGLQDITPENQEQINRLNSVAKELGISSGSLARKFTNAMKAGTFDEDFMTDLGFEEGQASPEQIGELFRLIDADSASEDPKVKSEKPSFGKFFKDMADKVGGFIPGGKRLSKKNQAILDKKRAATAAATAERAERSRTDPNSFANRLAAVEQADALGMPAIYRVEGAMEGFSPNQPPVAIDPKTGQPVQNPRRSLIPATLERFLGRKRVSGGQPIANATVEPVKPLRDAKGNLVPGRKKVNELGDPSADSDLLNVRNVAQEEPADDDGSAGWSPSGENRVSLGTVEPGQFGMDFGPNRKKAADEKTAEKSLYLFRTKEALKSYIQLKNIDTNKYVVVPIPRHLRDNRYLKSLNFNISNPSFKYMMVLKTFVAVTSGATPVLKVKELKENEDAKKNNNSHSEKKNPEFIKKYGKMNTKGAMESFLSDYYEDGEIPEDFADTPQMGQAQTDLDLIDSYIEKRSPAEHNLLYPDSAIEDVNPQGITGTVTRGVSSLIELPITKSKNSKDKEKDNKSKSKDSKKDDKVGKVMHEFKEGKLHSGKNGPKVTDKDQAMAIALSDAGKSKKKTSEKGNIVEKLADSTFNPAARDLVDSGKEGIATIIELTTDNKKDAKTKSKESLSDACWEGYEAIGFKNKGGKKVPNCVPKSKSKK